MKKTLKFILMVLGTAVAGGIFGGILGLIIGFAWRNTLFGFGGLAGAALGLIIGYPVGVIVGVILFWTLFKYTGSIVLGVIGALLGGVIPLGLSQAWSVLTAQWAFVAFAFLSPLLATAGFYLKRKPKEPEKKKRKK